MRKISRVTTEVSLKFGSEQTRTQFFEAATPGVEFAVEAPYLVITWRGESRGVPVARTHVEFVVEPVPTPMPTKR